MDDGNTHHVAGGSLTLKVEIKVILNMTSYDKDSLMVISHGHERVLCLQLACAHGSTKNDESYKKESHTHIPVISMI